MVSLNDLGILDRWWLVEEQYSMTDQCGDQAARHKSDSRDSLDAATSSARPTRLLQMLPQALERRLRMHADVLRVMQMSCEFG